MAPNYLSSSSAFCDLIAAARANKFPGHWSGSAYRSHPCGVIDGNLNLHNAWHVADYCGITVATDGWRLDQCQNPRVYGNPYPSSIGASATIWRNGRWQDESYRQAFERRVWELLMRIREHNMRAANWEAAIQAQNAHAAAIKKAAIVSAICAAA